jgi:hypothetical protein
MKKVLLSLSVATLLFANEYQDISQKFLEYQNSNKSIISQEILTKDNVEVGYLFNLSSGGYIIVPISKKLSPVKGYSFESNFENLPPKFKEYIINQLYLAATDKSLARVVDTTISDRWDFLENYTPSSNRTLFSYTANTTLLTTTWNQGYPYNKYFPKVGTDTTLAGCVQVAMGQVMNYHQYPVRGQGVLKNDIDIYSGSKNSGSLVRTDNLKAVLNRDYNWDIMPISHDDGLEYQNDELGYLMRDLLVLNKAMVGTTETLASANTSALVENFGYSNTIARMDNSDSSFISTIKAQIDLEQPVLFSVPGHMTVADGYKDDSSGNYIHINMGWGGAHNDFYNLDDSYIYQSNFTTNSGDLRAIYNIKPCSQSNGDCYVNLENTDTISSLDMSGTFDSVSDIDAHQLYLSGNTTFSLDRGYSGTDAYFYVGLYDSTGALVQEISDKETTINSLSTDLYTLKISLSKMDRSSYWNLQDGFNNYTVNITSGTVSASDQNTILAGLEVAPVIDQNISDKVITSDTKILIHGYDENNDDNVTFSATSNSNFDLTFNKNILNIHPTVASGHSTIEVKVSSNGQEATQEFDVLVNNEKIYFGKEFTISDTFADQSEFDKHKAILDGVCTVSGTRGYSNQAFFTSLMDISESYLVNNTDDTFNSSNLSQDLYLLGASITNQETNAAYSYDASFSAYTLNVSCPDADENITNIANVLGISLDTNNAPVITMDTTIEVNASSSVQIPYSISDIEDSGLTLSIDINPTNGNVSIDSNNVTYTPNNAFVGSDSFVVKTTDSGSKTVTKTVNVTVTTINTPPVIIMDNNISVDEDNSTQISYTLGDAQDDNSTLSLIVETNPSNGNVSINSSNVTYTPNANFFGNDSFVVKTTDSENETVTQEINVTVNSINDIPVLTINNTNVSVNSGSSVQIPYSISDVEDSSMTLLIDTNATNGIVSIDASNITYTPNSDFSGSDSFVVKTTDSNNETVTKSINITIQKVLPLITGWNLISADIDLSTVGDNDTPILWQYVDNNWSVHAPLYSQAVNFNQISDINSTVGTWVYSTKDLDLEITENNSTMDYSSYPAGWSLNGTNQDVNGTDISCSSGSVHSVWRFESNSWEVYTPSPVVTTITKFTTLEKNDGFWVDCQ